MWVIECVKYNLKPPVFISKCTFYANPPKKFCCLVTIVKVLL